MSAPTDLAARVERYNALVREAAALLPEFAHPALCPQLIAGAQVEANDYNPNQVAPPEMKLLAHSILRDGITMPVVTAPHPDDETRRVVVDGFHRTTLAKTHPDVQATLHGYVPVVLLAREKAQLMASTVRHNMARGSHDVELSSNLIAILTKFDWTDEKISEELGMDIDGITRMKCIAGLGEVFADRDYSMAWE
jgi:ParB-like chromosome segregation protein Spo0J